MARLEVTGTAPSAPAAGANDPVLFRYEAFGESLRQTSCKNLQKRAKSGILGAITSRRLSVGRLGAGGKLVFGQDKYCRQ